MGRCVHHIPGRARFRLPLVKCDKARAESARQALLALAGVRSVEVNRAAASLVVAYDENVVAFEEVTACLRKAGCLAVGGRHAPMPRIGGGLVAQAGTMFGRSLFTAVLERSINQGVSALIGRRMR